jgi:anti-sigma regulatory factor (Ser/Thr protein kinase)
MHFAMAQRQRPRCIEMRLPSSLDYEQIVRQTAEVVALHAGYEQSRIEALGTAVGEAYRNAVEHGNQGDDLLPVTIRFRVELDALVAEVADAGKGFVLPPPPDIDAQLAGCREPGGWGIYLMQHLVDSLSYYRSEGGEHVTRLCLHTGDGESTRQGEHR